MRKALGIEEDITAVERNEPDHHVKAGRLPRAVGAEQPDDLAAAHFERYVFDHDARLIAFLKLYGSKLAHDFSAMLRFAVPPPR
jgi:hypothetical protein